jgi:hypothetical protein
MATAVASTSHGQGTGVVIQPQVDWQICQRCAKKCKGARGLAQHKKACNRQEALRVQQLQGHGGNGHARRPLLAVALSAADWQWAASVDLEEELLPSIGLRQIRISLAARANLARTPLLFPLKRIEADPLDEGAWAVLLLFPTLVLGALDRGGDAGTRNLNARCRRFESGDWETLLAEHHEREDKLTEERDERVGGAQGGGEPSDAIAQERRIRRCLRLGRAGELSRAARALRQSRSAPTTEGTIETLRQLHPAAPSPIPPWVANSEPDESFQLDAAVLSRALDTAPSLSAGGPSGLLYEHYRDVLAEDPGAFAAFHVVCSLVARGQMPPRARAGPEQLQAFGYGQAY